MYIFIKFILHIVELNLLKFSCFRRSLLYSFSCYIKMQSKFRISILINENDIVDIVDIGESHELHRPIVEEGLLGKI